MREFKMSPELKAAWDAAVSEEKLLLKQRLRRAIAEKDKSWLFAYCVGQSAAAKKALKDTMLYGTGQYQATEFGSLWVLRYMRRLGVPFV